MPIYDYRCNSCNANMTITRGISEKEEVPVCASCNSPFIRVYSSIGVAFNGGGFYSTDKGK